MERNMKIIPSILLFFCIPGTVFAADDWAYELSHEARKIYENKIVQIQCQTIPTLLTQNNKQDLYISIRDAGLFQEKSCYPIIQKNLSVLQQMPMVRDAVAFYFLKLGDKEQMKSLVNDFDKEARATGDHATVDLFGYLNDWDTSGVRLVRHAAYSDAVGSELLCSAIVWRRYLYGEKNFKDNWYRVGKKEKVDKRRLDHFYETCRVEP
jgi:hypothetical protein